jgi:hypothetical protein
MLRSGLSKTAARAAARIDSNPNGGLRFMSAKVIKFGVDGRTAMLKGVETLADAVQVGGTRTRREIACCQPSMIRFLGPTNHDNFFACYSPTFLTLSH